ncbi:penicillin-binding protein activator LpoB [Massilia terrae]|uniref:Penicillin-binding protein activator LpoB n=1 Tax=Massilia terrae TaxID=1811224 RepID=A0ABT2D153_9BURK|nr:penicillin-binding protein activator LpoB [Massilia terrae]MCS0659964.1 penicillin-binding protein activator LpoB [Massilia terrae]
MNYTWKKFGVLAAAVLCACETPQPPPSRPVTYQDVSSVGKVAGVGVESQDIVTVSDVMVRDLLADPEVMKMPRVPRIIIDAEYLKNDSTQRLNKNLIVDRLRINLQRASRGKLSFLSRESAAMVNAERELKREGVTDAGTTGLTKAQAGADYRLIGHISTLDSRSTSTGTVERYTQLSFELIDLETGVSLWANQYEMKKGGLDDAVYR